MSKIVAVVNGTNFLCENKEELLDCFKSSCVRVSRTMDADFPPEGQKFDFNFTIYHFTDEDYEKFKDGVLVVEGMENPFMQILKKAFERAKEKCQSEPSPTVH